MQHWEVRLSESELEHLRPVGYWRSDMQPELPHPAAHVDAGWAGEERQATLDYLRRGAVCRRWHGYATCRLCSQSGRELGDADITDGSWIWPEGLPHYLEQHAVRPPEPFLCHLRERGFRSGGPIVPAEQTVSRLAPALLRGLERIEDKNGDKNGNAGAIRFRRTGPAGARDLVLGIEVDLTTGCFRIEYNEAALIAQRQQVERMMNPPWWRKLVRQIFG